MYNQGKSIPVSVTTIRRAVRASGFASFKPLIKLFVGEVNRPKRLKRAKALLGSADEWSCDLSKDESSFGVHGADKHARV